jgi:predicted ATPase with chaperone activity
MLTTTLTAAAVFSAAAAAAAAAAQARANRGILYVDEVNLLDDGLVDVVLDSSASGINTVEREGISIAHPAKFIMIGSGNPAVSGAWGFAEAQGWTGSNGVDWGLVGIIGGYLRCSAV